MAAATNKNTLRSFLVVVAAIAVTGYALGAMRGNTVADRIRSGYAA